MIDAQLALDELNDLLGANFSAEDIETLGGLVLHRLGHIPDENEVLQLDASGEPVEGGDQGLMAWRLTVLSVDRSRVGQVLVEKLEGQSPA